MATRYKFSDEEIRAIEQARKGNRDKRIENRLKALEMLAKGATAVEASNATGLNKTNMPRLIGQYRKKGLQAFASNGYKGNRRNMSVEEEAALLQPFKERAEAGQIIEVSEIARVYQAAVDHPVAANHIYRVLHRHGWRKIMPRSKHPQKASEEEIEASKKLKPESRS